MVCWRHEFKDIWLSSENMSEPQCQRGTDQCCVRSLQLLTNFSASKPPLCRSWPTFRSERPIPRWNRPALEWKAAERSSNASFHLNSDTSLKDMSCGALYNTRDGVCKITPKFRPSELAWYLAGGPKVSFEYKALDVSPGGFMQCVTMKYWRDAHRAFEELRNSPKSRYSWLWMHITLECINPFHHFRPAGPSSKSYFLMSSHLRRIFGNVLNMEVWQRGSGLAYSDKKAR